jgi:hypothetical protein
MRRQSRRSLSRKRQFSDSKALSILLTFVIWLITKHHVRKNSKSSTWENLVVLRSFDKKTWSFWDHLTKRLGRFEIIWQKDLVVLKPAQVIQWYERDRANANQWRDRTIKTNVKRLNMAKFLVKKIAFSEFKRGSVKSPSAICERSSSSCFYRIQMMWKIIVDNLRMFSRKSGTMYE